MNDCYPEKDPNRIVEPIPYEHFVAGITNRGMDSFVANGPHIIMDTTDLGEIDIEALVKKISGCVDVCV